MKNRIQYQNGVSLVEILVSIAVGLFILAGVVQLYATSTQNASMVTGSSSIQENVRFLFSRIEQDVSRAGYAGCLNFNVDAKRITNIATQTTTPVFNAAQFVAGDDNVSTSGKTFDKMILRYAGNSGRVPVQTVASNQFTVDTTQSHLFNQGDVVVVGDCSSFGVFRVSNAPGDTGNIEFATGTYNSAALNVSFSDANSIVPTITYLYSGTGAFQYYVATSSAGTAVSATCSATTPQYCALYRKSSAEANADQLVEGVEAFEVEYGWRNASDGKLFFANAGSVSSWDDVDRVRITATLSSPNKTATNEGVDYIQRTYSRTFFFFNQIPEA